MHLEGEVQLLDTNYKAVVGAEVRGAAAEAVPPRRRRDQLRR